MKTSPLIDRPAPPVLPPLQQDPELIIDTSKMSRGQREALELTEAARETEELESSFAGNLFMGKFDLGRLHPFPEQPERDRKAGAPFLADLEHVLRHSVDPDAIDAEGEIPDAVFAKLAEIGAFGIKIPSRYGGLGLSQVNYSRAAMLLGSYCGNLTALLSAHQSIGVPQPLLVFGTEAQKRKFLPRLAAGELSAFALTETEAGSDPAKMKTTAQPDPTGRYFILNGEKLWCTNGTRAGLIVVMARTPDRVKRNGKKKTGITAFVVERDSPGLEILHRCRFMGLKALYNGVLRFRDVKVPRENIIAAEGKGLKVALTTLNTGRITLPAACLGLSKRCLRISRQWASEREQWGAPIGHHAAIAEKIARMAADVFTLESIVLLTSVLVDRKTEDTRLESAICKMWGTETAWRIVNDTLQIRGGRGYETAASLKARGEEPVPVERFMRDSRINLIFEGSSEIMRLLIAREALDPHLKVAGSVLNPHLPLSRRLKDGLRATAFYARWYPQLWRFDSSRKISEVDPALRPGFRYVQGTSRKLARALFHSMARYGPKLEREQVLLGRIVDLGAELFALTASLLRADRLIKEKDPVDSRKELLPLVNLIFGKAKQKIASLFRDLQRPNDRLGRAVAREVLSDRLIWIEEGIVFRDHGAGDKFK